jgi:hypothetical protein
MIGAYILKRTKDKKPRKNKLKCLSTTLYFGVLNKKKSIFSKIECVKHFKITKHSKIECPLPMLLHNQKRNGWIPCGYTTT